MSTGDRGAAPNHLVGGYPPAVVVPAAGRAARMGEPKLLLRYRGEPLIRRAVRIASEIAAEPVVVLRPDDQATAAALADAGCLIVHNPEPDRGQASSIARGIRAVLARSRGRSEAAPDVVVLLPDMPHIEAWMLRHLLAHHRRDGGVRGVTASHRGVASPPVVLPAALLGGLVAAEGRLRRRLIRGGHRLRTVELPRGALDDVDTPSDRRRLLGPEDGPGGSTPPHMIGRCIPNSNSTGGSAPSRCRTK